MFLRSIFAVASFLCPVICLIAQSSDSYQTRYAANLNHGESFVDITNTGFLHGSSPAGDICANMYVFDARGDIQSCCSCPTIPNGVYSFGVNRDLIRRTITDERPTTVAIKLTATLPVDGVCDPASPGRLTSGLRAWGTTLHASPNGGYALTESEFLRAAPASANELGKLVRLCGAVEDVGGDSIGICGPCRIGALVVGPGAR